MTALLSKHLQDYFKAEEYPVITLHIDEDVLDHQTEIVEDFLVATFRGLEYSRTIQVDKALPTYYKYCQERDATGTEGCRRRERLRLIRKAVHLAMANTGNLRAYLLLDGIDRCGATIRLLLELELSALQRLGMSILLTSRLAVFENEEATCDHSSLPLSMRKTLDVYMQCESCEETIICLPCMREGKTCEEWYVSSSCALNAMFTNTSATTIVSCTSRISMST